MKSLAKLFGTLIMLIGARIFVAPAMLATLAHALLTPVGLYVIAAVRIAIGVVFILAAPASRAPRLLRAIGIFVIIAGIATPLFGLERSQGAFEWLIGQGPVFVRAVAVLAVAVGALILYLVGPGKRAPA